MSDFDDFEDENEDRGIRRKDHTRDRDGWKANRQTARRDRAIERGEYRGTRIHRARGEG